MRIQHTVVVFDAADIGRKSAFWAALLGGPGGQRLAQNRVDGHARRV